MLANLTPEYKAAEAVFREARDLRDRLRQLREMLRVIPKHKGTDHLQADIKRRIKELSEELERGRDGVPAGDVGAMIRSERAPTTGPFPADLDQQLAALKAAGFRDVDCFWKELGRALVGGYA